MLTGHGQGATRHEIITQATGQAAQYYSASDRRCIAVTLTDEACIIQEYGMVSAIGKTVVTGYTANWTATVQHRMDAPAYGFPKCVYCKYEEH